MQPEKNQTPTPSIEERVRQITQHWKTHFSLIPSFDEFYWKLLTEILESSAFDDNEYRCDIVNYINSMRRHCYMFDQLSDLLDDATIIDMPGIPPGEQRN